MQIVIKKLALNTYTNYIVVVEGEIGYMPRKKWACCVSGTRKRITVEG